MANEFAADGEVFVCGACGKRSRDKYGSEENEGILCRVYPAEWEVHGRAAGPIRNGQMLSIERPDVVVAFPGGRGTADMMARAVDAGVRVVDVAEKICSRTVTVPDMLESGGR